MKGIFIFFVFLFGISSAATAQLKVNGKEVNTGKLIDVGTDITKVVMLTDMDAPRPYNEKRIICTKQKADKDTQTQQ